MRILIGYDGSVPADGALYELERAGLPAKAEAVVLCVTTAWVEFVSPHGSRKQVWPGRAANPRYRHALEQCLGEAQALAERGRRFLQRAFPDWKIKAEAAMDDAAEGILKKAGTWKADLIILGSHGRSAFGRLLLGSVSQNVLHHSPVSVRITRAGLKQGKRPIRLMLGMDGSAGADAAVAAVAGRTWPKNTEVRVVGVADTRSNLYFPALEAGFNKMNLGFIPDEKARLEKPVEAAVARLTARGLRVQSKVGEGDPRAVLLQEAEEWGAHCIFLGSRGLSATERLLLGSISSAVATHARCTVEIVRSTKKKPKTRNAN